MLCHVVPTELNKLTRFLERGFFLALKRDASLAPLFYTLTSKAYLSHFLPHERHRNLLSSSVVRSQMAKLFSDGNGEGNTTRKKRAPVWKGLKRKEGERWFGFWTLPTRGFFDDGNGSNIA